ARRAAARRELSAARGRRAGPVQALVRGCDARSFRQCDWTGAMRLLLALLAVVNIAWAQDYPARPVTVIVPFSTGSASDVIARILLERMSVIAGQRFIIDNRPAAGGAVGTAAAVKVAPDGYTLLMGALGPLIVAKMLQPALAYDAERDFQPISLYGRLP